MSSPGTADDALTVGSVSKRDEPSPFSSGGPRLGDGTAKPEISAPGGGIVAARPTGVPPLGEPVGDGYQRLDGGAARGRGGGDPGSAATPAGPRPR